MHCVITIAGQQWYPPDKVLQDIALLVLGEKGVLLLLLFHNLEAQQVKIDYFFEQLHVRALSEELENF